ncbi:MAG: F0F1 ATP synthase subunit gamma [bacterium]
MATIRQLKEEINGTITFFDVAEVLSTIASMAFANISKLYEANFIKLNKAIDQVHGYINKYIPLFAEEIPSEKPEMVERSSSNRKKAAILVGSNLGFCGKFNNEIKLNYANYIGQLSDFDYVFIIGRQLFAIHETQYKIPFPVAKKIIWNELIDVKTASVNDIIDVLEESKQDVEISVLSNSYNPEIKKGYLSDRKFLYPSSFELTNLENIKTVGYYQTLGDVILEPESSTFLTNLLKYYFNITFLSLLVQSEIAENYERMNSMNQAKDEIDIILKKLKRKLQKMRQAKITNELLEVIGAQKK